MWAQVLAIGSSTWRRADAWHKHTLKPQLLFHTRSTSLTSTHTQATITHSRVNQSFSEPFGGLIPQLLASGSRQYPFLIVLSCGLGQWARPARPALPSVCMAALSCLSISGAWRHTSTQLGHQRQWACCLIQTQARRQSDALQDPSESPTAAPPAQ